LGSHALLKCEMRMSGELPGDDCHFRHFDLERSNKHETNCTKVDLCYRVFEENMGWETRPHYLNAWGGLNIMLSRPIFSSNGP